MQATTVSGARVTIIGWSTDAYHVRYTDTGAIRWVPREAMRPAEYGQKGGK